MKSTDHRLSQTVKELAHSNQLLQVMMEELRELLSEPLDTENTEWITAIVNKMLGNLDQEAELEEQTEYLQDVLERFPTWHPQLEHLREQHQLLHRQLRQIEQRLEPRRAKHVPREVCRELRDWLDTYEGLRRREANLIHEAFVLDVGEGE